MDNKSRQLALTVVAFTCTSTSEIDYYLQAIPPLASLEAIHVQFLTIVFFYYYYYNGKMYHNIKMVIFFYVFFTLFLISSHQNNLKILKNINLKNLNFFKNIFKIQK